MQANSPTHRIPTLAARIASGYASHGVSCPDESHPPLHTFRDTQGNVERIRAKLAAGTYDDVGKVDAITGYVLDAIDAAPAARIDPDTLADEPLALIGPGGDYVEAVMPDTNVPPVNGPVAAFAFGAAGLLVIAVIVAFMVMH